MIEVSISVRDFTSRENNCAALSRRAPHREMEPNRNISRIQNPTGRARN